MIELRFVLPWGVSANAYWRSMRTGRLAGIVLLSREAREYRKRVAEALVEQRVPSECLAGSLEIEMVAHPPTRRTFDLDNRIKPLLDALTHCGVIEDDKFFDRVEIRRGAIVSGGRVEVCVRQRATSAVQQEIA